tara:strand:- start:2616 stop:2795 length:180 start_codon:yes stop_codon:yes gene_type:complete
MIPLLGATIVTKILKLALKGKISEKVMIQIVIGLGDILVKSTKNKLDDKLWEKMKETLK